MMSSQNLNQDLTLESLLAKLDSLEHRVASLETSLGLSGQVRPHPQGIMAEDTHHVNGEAFPGGSLPDGSSIEATIGGSGLAWLGNIVLLLGITFLMQFLLKSGSVFFPFLLGYASVVAIFMLSRYAKKHYPDMAFLFNMNGHLLLYFVTLRLHFFSTAPLLQNKSLVLGLLIAVSLAQIIIALRKNSEVLAGLALVLACITGIMGNTTHFMLPMLVLVAGSSVYFIHRFGWWRLMIISLILVYLTQLMWLIGNPVISHQIHIIQGHHYGYFYLFPVAAIFSMLALLRPGDRYPGTPVITGIVLNGLGFSLLIGLYTLSFFKDNYIAMFGSVAVFCLAFSILLKFRSEWKITAAFYALYSFVALSVTVYGIYDFPRSYLLLSIQSVLVVSMALWFRSKAIVVMNTFLFIILLMAYLTSKEHLSSISFSFALTALVTARILNWRKGLLEIKTELMRNTYLTIGFIMLLYALYKAVPGEYVTLSWTLAAVLYFIMSILIRNVKYRYLALGSMLAAAFYLFIVDLASVELVFRIVALLFLSLISLGVSLYYRKRLKKAPAES